MKNIKTITILIFTLPFTSLYGQYILSPSDTNLYQIIAKWDTILPSYDTIEDGPRTQFNRWKSFWEPRLYPSGSFHIADSLFSDYTQSFDNANRISNTIQASWIPLGPSYPTGLGIGKVLCIAFDPTNNNTIFCGTWGGVWKSTNLGVNWSQLNTDHQLPHLGITTIAINPSNTNYIYIGSGYNGYGSSFGVYRSSDGGTTWTPVNSGLSSGGALHHITKLLIDPNTPNTIYAATSGGIFKTTNASTSCTWSLLSTPGSNPYYVNIHFGSSSQVLYACGVDVIQTTNSGTSWSTTGVPFTDIHLNGTTIYNINMDVVYNSSLYLYAGINTNTGRHIYFYDGSTWTYKSTVSMDYGRFPIAVSPTQPASIIFTGAIGFYYSVNGGSSFSGNSSACHVDYFSIVFDPGNSNTLYIGNDGGLCKYDFTTGPFTSTATYRSNGLEIATSTNVSSYSTVNPDRDLILSGHFDDGSNLYDSSLPVGSQWDYKSGGDGFEQKIDYADPQNMYSTTYGCFTVNGNGCMYKSTDEGINWSQAWSSHSEPALFGAPLAIDPINHLSLYQGRTNIWKTTDRWSTKGKISDFNTEHSTGFYQVSAAIAIAPNNNQYIYNAVIGNPVRLFRTIQGGNINGTAGNCPNPVNNRCWEDVTPYVPIQPSPIISAIAVSDKNPDIVWVSYANYDPSLRVKKSTNGGTTWTDYNNGLPAFPINHIVYERGSNDGIYAATDIGVWYRNKTMTQWEPFNDNLPNTIVKWLDINYTKNTIVAGTWGRSVWESHLNCPDDYDLTASGTAAFYEAEHDLTASTSFTPNPELRFRAGNQIDLEPDFEVGSSSTTLFEAYIHPCNTPGNSNPLRTLSNANFSLEDASVNKNLQVDLKIFPNPVHDIINIKATGINSVCKFSLFDLEGREVKEGKFYESLTLSVASLKAGIYIYEITVEKGNSLRGKLIKE